MRGPQGHSFAQYISLNEHVPEVCDACTRVGARPNTSHLTNRADGAMRGYQGRRKAQYISLNDSVPALCGFGTRVGARPPPHFRGPPDPYDAPTAFMLSEMYWAQGPHPTSAAPPTPT